MSNSPSYSWPKEFPTDIPSADAKPAEGYVYRLVEQVPPSLSDFNMYRVDRPDRPFLKKEIPESFGLSLWKKLNHILRQKERYSAPEQFGNKKIVGGELCSDLGVIIVKKNSHVTLWKQNGAEPHLHICDEII